MDLSTDMAENSRYRTGGSSSLPVAGRIPKGIWAAERLSLAASFLFSPNKNPLQYENLTFRPEQKMDSNREKIL